MFATLTTSLGRLIRMRMLAQDRSARRSLFYSCIKTGRKLVWRRNLPSSLPDESVDLTVGPVLTVTTKRMLDHVAALLKIPGARIAFGAEELENHSIPKIYGAVKPTAIFVPLEEFVKTENFELERMDAHLTAAVVSNDQNFVSEVLSATVNGTTYSGIRARTTGAPQNHWFGPAGDPCAGVDWYAGGN
ncbi:unnamed protein product [Peronospora belbahrii]|uniref:Aldehyde dehydrogenase domain-containing protein n=1 Tax=Peronospora belbahrii TaxID=622444 RepID=A0ABN8CUR5_9STRA|nr:unnamed protein product [Peronospora belbahrii]